MKLSHNRAVILMALVALMISICGAANWTFMQHIHAS